MGPRQLLCLADQRLASILQRQPLTKRALVLGDRLAATVASVGQRGLCLQQSLRLQRPICRGAGLLYRRGKTLPRSSLGDESYPRHQETAALRVEEPRRRPNQPLHANRRRNDQLPLPPLP